jgi:hypothetical protein
MDKTMIGLIIAAAIVLGLLFFNDISSIINKPETGEYDSFAQCLTESEIQMYGTEWCSHCKTQKKLFGESFKLVDYTDCDKNREICLKAGIKGYPTWKFNGESYPGVQSLNKLAQLTGCVL